MPQYRFEEQNLIRSVGVDDGRFSFNRSPGASKDKAILAAVILEGTRIVAIKIGKIEVDGLDSTKTLIRLLKDQRFDTIFLSGISFAGFNIINPHQIFNELKKPVIIICRSRPNNRSMKRALRLHFNDWKSRWAIIQRVGKANQIRSCAREPPLYFEIVGVSIKLARKLIRQSSKVSRLPEPIRVAGLVAKGLSRVL